MNDHPDFLPEPDDDSMLEEMLSNLKRLEPPLETRISIRMAVAAELSSLRTVNRQRNLSWWRRSISIPVPIAASLVVLIVFALQSSFRDWQERSSMHVAAPDQPAVGAAHVRGENAAIAKRTPNAQAVLNYYETETYLCGVGRVSSASGCSIEE